MGASIRILFAIPHFFDSQGADTTNRSRLGSARKERLQAAMATICGIHQVFGSSTYGLDHGEAKALPMARTDPHEVDVVVCTTNDKHLVNELIEIGDLFYHHKTEAEPLLLGFECHKLLRDSRGRYDYYCYVEDDIVFTDPLFFRKREMFDRLFPAVALLQPNRYEIAPTRPVMKLYVDYRLNRRVTAPYQNVDEEPSISMPFLGDTMLFERTTYPSAGCFFVNTEQLDLWVKSPNFLDGDVSYMSPLDSAVTLSIMKTFRVYKPVLEQAWFLEVLHASPRWIGSVTQIATVVQT